MARGTPTAFSGTFSGTNQVQDLYTQVKTRINAYQSNSVNAWEDYDAIATTAGSRNYCFRSLGDRTLVSGAGDAGLFLRMSEAAAVIEFHAYQDWSTNASGSGAREAYSSSYARWSTLSTIDTIDYWGVSNEYEFTFVFVQGGTYRWAHFGTPMRTHIPTDGNGIAFLSSSASSGSNVVLSVDRNLSSDVGFGKLTAGQKIWIYNQTGTGNALETSTVELVTVSAVTSTTVTIDALASNKASGAIIGLDPCPMGVCASTNGDPSVPFTNHKNGSYTSAAAQLYTNDSLMNTLTEGSHDPAPNDLYYGALMFPAATVAAGGIRGTWETLSAWAIGTQSDQDRMKTDYAGTAAKAWKIFPSLINNTYFCTAIGPGFSS